MNKNNKYESIFNLITSEFPSTRRQNDFKRVEEAYNNNLLLIRKDRYLIPETKYVTLYCLPGKTLDSIYDRFKETTIMLDSIYDRFKGTTIISDLLFDEVTNKLEPTLVVGDEYFYAIGDAELDDKIYIACNEDSNLVYITIKAYSYLYTISRINMPLGKRTLERDVIKKYSDSKIDMESFYNYMMHPNHSNGAFDVLLKEYRRRYNITSDEAAALSLERQLRRGI